MEHALYIIINDDYQRSSSRIAIPIMWNGLILPILTYEMRQLLYQGALSVDCEGQGDNAPQLV
jgi:hypothetical protein